MALTVCCMVRIVFFMIEISMVLIELVPDWALQECVMVNRQVATLWM